MKTIKAAGGWIAFAVVLTSQFIVERALAQTTLYTDSFSGAGTALNGTLVQGGSLQGGAVAWSANSPFRNNGTLDGSVEGSAILPFAPVVNAQYTLSMDVSNTTDRWIGLGFKSTALGSPGADQVNDRFSNGGGMAWMLYRDHLTDATQDIQLFGGPNVTNPIADTNPEVNFAQSNNLKIVLNTTGAGASFTADYFLNGVSISSGPQVVNQAVSSIQFVGLTYDDATATAISYDNFLLTQVITGSPANEWNVNGGGVFSTAGNWTMGAPTAGSTVLFGGVLTAANSPATVSLTAPASLGEVQFSNAAATYNLAGPSALTLTGAAKATVLAGQHEITAAIGGTAGLVKSGSGTLILNSNNTYTGLTDVQQGSLQLRNSGGVDGNVTVASGASLFFRGDAAASGAGFTGAFAGDISGAGEVGLGDTLTTETVTFTAAKSYTGVTTVAGGTLQLSGAGRPGAADGTAASRTQLSGNQGRGKVSLSGGAAVGNEVLVLGAREGAAINAVHLTSAGANSWAGAIKGEVGGTNYNIESTSGTLTLSGLLSAPDSGARNFVFDGAGNTNLSGKITDLATDANGVPQIGPINLANNVNVIKRGAGTLTIGTVTNLNDDYWLGATTVEGGTLEVISDGANNGELKSGTIEVRAGATLDVDHFGVYTLQPAQRLSGGGTVRATGKTVSIFDDNHLTPGDGVGTLAINGTVTLTGEAPGGSLNYQLGDATTVGGSENDLIQIGGALSTIGTPVMTLNVTAAEGDLANGTYRLISHTGAATDMSGITPQLVSNNGNVLNPRQTLAVSGATAGQVNLTVAGNEAALTWNGTVGNATWDVNTSTNWTGADGRFRDLDDVTFGVGGVKNVTVNSNVAPGSTTFGGGVGSTYSLTGSGGITGFGPVNVNSGTVRLLNTDNNFAGTTTIASGSRLQMVSASTGGMVVNGTLAVNSTYAATVIDTFSDTTLTEYTFTKILDQGTVTNTSFSSPSGVLQSTSVGADGAEQVLFLRNDGHNIDVGEELVVDATILQANGNDLGIAIGKTPTAGVREDFMFVSFRGATQLNSRGFIGATELAQVQAFGVNADQLFIARTANDVFEVGYYSDGTRTVMRTENTAGNTTLANNVGFYSDLRADAVGYNGLDNLRLASGEANNSLQINGNLSLAASGELELDISAFGYSSLDVTGSATLAGVLSINLLGGFQPAAGTEFALVTAAGGINASGLSFDLPTLTGGLTWDTSTFGADGVLSVVSAIPGDFDGDGNVDGADLAQWRADFGPGPGSDADGDGDSDGSDFLIWQQNLGSGAPASAAAAAVPEPGAYSLLVSALLLCVVASRGALRLAPA